MKGVGSVRKPALLGAILLVALVPGVAAAQEATPAPEPETQLVQPLIEGRDLLVLLIVVSGLALLLLAWMVWISPKLENAGDGSTYVTMIQGMVLVTVVVAVILLGVSGKITEEGLSTILAAIVGFAVGKSAESVRGRRDGAPGRAAGGAAAAVPPPAVD